MLMPCFESLRTATAKSRSARLLWLGAWVGLLWACSPTYNWREVRADGTGLVATLPCKPDHGKRDLPLVKSRSITVSMVGCKAGVGTYAVAWADVGRAGDVADAMAKWKQATLQPFRGGSIQPLAHPGLSLARRQDVEAVSATVRQADGAPLTMQAMWFASGTQVFQALVFADALPEEITEPFWRGLGLK
jgi:hypothetical protein